MDNLTSSPVHFSVVIPLYNKQDQIQRAIRSVLAQTYPDFEVIVVDDGSIDSSYDKAAEICDPRIRIIRQNNAGEGAARNRGIKEARHDLIAFLDADDEWKPNFLENICLLVEKFPDCVLYATGCEQFQNKQGTNWPTRDYFPLGWCGIIPDYIKIIANARSPFNSSSTVATRPVLNEVAGFPEGVVNGADIAAWIRCSIIGDIAYLHLPLSIYYVGLSNSASNSYDWRKEYYPVKVLRQLLKENRLPANSRQQAFYFISKYSLMTARARFKAGEPINALAVLWNCRLSKRIYHRVVELILQEFLPSIKKWFSRGLIHQEDYSTIELDKKKAQKTL